MSREAIFAATKGTFALFGGFLKDVAREIGMEKALDLYANQGETFGAMFKAMIGEELGEKELDTPTMAAVLSKAAEGFGMTVEIEESPTSVRMESFQCPIYDGFKEAGLDQETIETACSRLVVVEQAELKKAYPQLSMCVKVRSAPDEPCIEEYIIEK
jgi:hypothetical protein